jgi:hypothetical protein
VVGKVGVHDGSNNRKESDRRNEGVDVSEEDVNPQLLSEEVEEVVRAGVLGGYGQDNFVFPLSGWRLSSGRAWLVLHIGRMTVADGMDGPPQGSICMCVDASIRYCVVT